MFNKLFQKQIYEEIKRAYDAGMQKGFELGRLYERSHQDGSGVILSRHAEESLSPLMQRQIEEIMEKES